jgi:hypothetical protein
MKLQHGTNIKFDFPLIGCGKSGYGFYSYKSNNQAMRKYYDSGHIMEFEVDDLHIIDITILSIYKHAKCWIENQLNKKITKSIFQQSGHLLHAFIRKFYPNAKGFVNFHFGSGLPTSKEIIIFDTSIIKNIKWIK